MYIPKTKQKIGAPLDGGSLTDKKTGKVYSGLYVQDYLGKYYKGTNIGPDSEELLYSRSDSASDGGMKTVTNLYHHYITPSTSDYEKGYYTRYFIKDDISKLIKEVDQLTYSLEFQANKTYRKTYQLVWFLSKKDIKKNERAIEEAEKALPTIHHQILKSPEQFVR